MLTIFPLEGLLEEAALCRLRMSESELHARIQRGEVAAYMPGDLLSPIAGSLAPPGLFRDAPQGFVSRWNGHGGWPRGLLIPWAALLLFAPGGESLDLLETTHAAFELTHEKHASFDVALDAWLERMGCMGQMTSLLPLMSETVLESLRGTLRLEMRAVIHRQQGIPRSVRNRSRTRLSATGTESLVEVRPSIDEETVVTLPPSAVVTRTPTPTASMHRAAQNSQSGGSPAAALANPDARIQPGTTTDQRRGAVDSAWRRPPSEDIVTSFDDGSDARSLGVRMASPFSRSPSGPVAVLPEGMVLRASDSGSGLRRAVSDESVGTGRMPSLDAPLGDDLGLRPSSAPSGARIRVDLGAPDTENGKVTGVLTAALTNESETGLASVDTDKLPLRVRPGALAPREHQAQTGDPALTRTLNAGGGRRVASKRGATAEPSINPASLRSLLEAADDAIRRQTIIIARDVGELDAMEQIASTLGDDLYARFLMDRAQALRGDRAAASERVDSLRRAFQLQTKLQFEAGSQLAQELRTANDPGEEVEVLERLIQVAGPLASILPVIRRLGSLLAYDLGQPERAITAYQDAIATGQHDESMLTELGSWLMTAGRESELVEVYLRCVHDEQDADRARLYFHRLADLVLIDAVDAETAQSLMHEAMERIGRDVECARALLHVVRVQGDEDGELEHAEFILASGGSDPGGTIATRIAEILVNRGDISRAEHYVRDACGRDDLATLALVTLDRCVDEVALDLGDPRLAGLWWRRRALQAGHFEGAWELWYRAGRQFAAAGDADDEAAALLDRALEHGESSGVARAELAAVHALAGKVKRRLHRFTSAAHHAKFAVGALDSASREAIEQASDSDSPGPGQLRDPLRSTDPYSLLLFSSHAIRDGQLDDAVTALEHAANLLTPDTDPALRARIFSLLATVYEQLQAHGT
jgi:tetratricopeptide (TPR) repeat protein